MEIEEYIERRNEGQSLEGIQNETLISEDTVWTLELGYQCYLRQIPLVHAISIINKVTMINPSIVN